MICRNGGIGRHEGLKIPWLVMAVRVRVPLAAHFQEKYYYYLLLCAKISSLLYLYVQLSHSAHVQKWVRCQLTILPLLPTH